MPQIYFTRKSQNRTETYFAEMPRRENNLSPTALNRLGKSGSSSTDCISIYQSLPDYLVSCLDYCAIVTTWRRFLIGKGKMVQLLLAESLIPEKGGEIIDNIANNIIEELIDLGLLVLTKLDYGWAEFKDWNKIIVPEPFRILCLVEVDEVEFFAKAANLPVRAIIEHDRKHIPLPPDFGTLQIRSLFLITNNGSDSQGLSRAYMATICKLQYLLVLHFRGIIKRLSEEVGDLVHLRYLCCDWSYLDELPQTLGNLQNLQTLDIILSRQLKELPLQVLNYQQLRHLMISKTTYRNGVRVPSGIGTFKYLRTLDGVYAGGGILSELSSLTQLQQLGITSVSEDHSTELFPAITKMENLISLSLEAEKYLRDSFLPDLESFSPPPSIQDLRLYGRLFEMPVWLTSMENLTMLFLGYSDLLENQARTLQFLPKLKLLYICNAYKVRCIGKEFCEASGFPKLEFLEISEDLLVEWTDIVNGAFPSLRRLVFSNCWNLRFLPEGLQNIFTLEELGLFGVHEDLGRRLLGEENYKIKHISKVHIP
ncbi:disease resistance protein RPM1 isoform X2 [Jatropha curcas]|uniref:disease resistance protein RPM1 isoform X2 n=1 Tax=Jatropha curcas TaxID=180498 RepID=UPI001893783D|nr:disease resistance protein RPM1 isoform X2 [Jatropha curcas]